MESQHLGGRRAIASSRLAWFCYIAKPISKQSTKYKWSIKIPPKKKSLKSSASKTIPVRKESIPGPFPVVTTQHRSYKATDTSVLLL